MYRLARIFQPAAAVSALLLGLFVSACSESGNMPAQSGPTASEGPAASEGPMAFEGARVIVGDGSVIENATFVVDDAHIVAVGAAGEVDVPAGAARVDLTGMTVMPAIIDAHTHMSTTRDALVKDLKQRATMGIGAVLSLGADGLDVPLEIRDELIPGAARYRSAGRGITGEEPGRTEVPHWVTTPEEARQAVRDEAARNVDIIKIWVDDRNGQYKKLTPDIYGAAIEEAHRNGLRTAAHIFALEDGKGLLRAGIDVFAHGVRDRDIDDEFVSLMHQHPNVILVPNLPPRGVPTDLSWLEGVLPADQYAAAQAANTVNPEAQETHGIQARNLARLAREGVRIAFGTDGNVFWAPHVEMEDMVAAGMTPAQVLVSATRNAAAVIGLTDMGTIERGKSADFIVLEANPLDDITNTRRIADVYLRGAKVDRSL